MNLNCVLSAFEGQLRSFIREISLSAVWKTGLGRSKRECKQTSQEARAEIQARGDRGFGWQKVYKVVDSGVCRVGLTSGFMWGK